MGAQFIPDRVSDLSDWLQSSFVDASVVAWDAAVGRFRAAVEGVSYISPQVNHVDPTWISSLAGSKVAGDIPGNAASITGAITTAQVSGLDAALTGKAATVHYHYATDITAGTLDDARIGTNIPRLDSPNIFTSNQTIVSQSPTAKTLTVKGSVSQTADLQQWLNSAGTVLASVSNIGFVNVAGMSVNGSTFTVNSSPFTLKVSGALIMTASYGGAYQIGPDSRAYNGIYIGDHNVRTGLEQGIFVGKSIGVPNGRLHVYNVIPSSKALVVQGTVSQTANLQEWQNSAGAVQASISENGYATTSKNSAPADAELTNGEAAYWFDSTVGAARFMVKAKNSSGVVVTGSIPLA